MEEIKGFLNKDALSKYVPKIPSELGLSYKWELTLEKLALHSTIGFVSCGLASLVLFRAGKFRVGMTAFGTGFGAGDAFRLANQEFEKELKK